MKKHVNCITINTDASFHPKHMVGGYAFYIVCDLFKIQKGGMFKNEPHTAQKAEIMAIANAIATLLAQKELPTATHIRINNDCTYGMEEIKNARKEGEGMITRKLLIELQKKTGAKHPKFRHVKAHNGAPDARSWVNEWCDTEAKKWMRKAIIRKQNRQKIESNH